MFDWLEAAIKMNAGSEVYVPLGDTSYTIAKKHLDEAKERYASVDQLGADQLQSRALTTADGKRYLVISKRKPVPAVAFVREASGTVTPIFARSNERKRMIKQMTEDGLSFEQMKEILSDLSLEEL